MGTESEAEEGCLVRKNYKCCKKYTIFEIAVTYAEIMQQWVASINRTPKFKDAITGFSENEVNVDGTINAKDEDDMLDGETCTGGLHMAGVAHAHFLAFNVILLYLKLRGCHFIIFFCCCSPGLRGSCIYNLIIYQYINFERLDFLFFYFYQVHCNL